MTDDRIALALEASQRRRASRLYGEILAYLADRPTDNADRESLGAVLEWLDHRRTATPRSSESDQ